MNDSSEKQTVEIVMQKMADSDSFQLVEVVPRKQAIELLSSERGRSPDHPLDPTLISHWCADLGFDKWLAVYTPDQMSQLRAVNHHYAGGGSRAELLEKMRRNPQWYVLKT
jgi:hypothetical protein